MDDGIGKFVAWFWSDAHGLPLWQKAVYALVSAGLIVAIVALIALDGALNG